MRVSTDAQVREGFSIEAQTEKGIQKSKELELEYDVFEEPGKSASKEDIENRPQLQKLIDGCDKGIYKNIFVTEQDRLSRNEMVYLTLKKIFHDNQIIVHTLTQRIDYTNYEDEFVSGLLSLLARRENKQRVARSERARLKSYQSGKWRGGMPPYGYKSDENNNLIIDEEEKEIYLKMIEMSLSGKGSNKIACWLNENNITTKSQKYYRFAKGIHLKDRESGKIHFKPIETITWKQPVVLGILRNAFYKGEARYKNNKIKVPAIIDEITWSIIQKNLDKQKILNKRNHKQEYLLRGLLFCNRCGSRLYGLIKLNRSMRQYTCLSKKTGSEIPNCGLRSLNLDKIHSALWEYVSQIMIGKGAWDIESKEIESKKELEQILRRHKKRFDGFNKEMDKLIQLFTKSKIDEPTFDRYSNTIEEQKDQLEKDMKTIRKQLTVVQERENIIREKTTEAYKYELLQKYSIQEKREIIDVLIEKIIIEFHQEKFDYEVKIQHKIQTDDFVFHIKTYSSEIQDFFTRPEDRVFDDQDFFDSSITPIK